MPILKGLLARLCVALLRPSSLTCGWKAALTVQILLNLGLKRCRSLHGEGRRSQKKRNGTKKAKKKPKET